MNNGTACMPDTVLSDWAHRIAQARATAIHRETGKFGLTQAELGELAGVAQATISKLEKAQFCPTDDLKWRLAAAVGRPMNDLFPYPNIVPVISVA